MCHHCTILPRRVLEKLEKEKKVKLITDDLSNRFRKKRNAALSRRFDLMRPGNGDRYVYDSENSENQRLTLARTEGSPITHDADVNAAYRHAGIIRRYFKEELQWNSIDDRGMDEIFNVHLSVNYNNAFWDGDEMSFGDGDGIHFRGFARALDVTAHELTHGVIQYTARLEYKSQPGALNEHFADVFATVIKQYHKGQNEFTGNWLIGDEIMGPELKGRAIRSMKNPSDTIVPLDPQPEHMNDYYTGDDDLYGVHINSGIANKAFYLVARKIGTFAAGKLWFEALKKLSSRSGFIELYYAVVDSIPDLYTSGTVPLTVFKAVQEAFSGTGILAAENVPVF